MTRAKISLSVADIPIGVTYESLFKAGAENGADGVELVLGWRTRFDMSLINRLSDKYRLPVLSVHEPFWGMFNLLREEGSMAVAGRMGVPYVIHPPLTRNIESETTQTTLGKIADMAKKTGVRVLLENMPAHVPIEFIDRIWPTDESVVGLTNIHRNAKRFNFGVTFDTSHWRKKNPALEDEYRQILPEVENIHISDFKGRAIEHLALGDGEMDCREYLKSIKGEYDRLVTLELSPRWTYPKEKYVEETARSLKLIMEVLG